MALVLRSLSSGRCFRALGFRDQQLSRDDLNQRFGVQSFQVWYWLASATTALNDWQVQDLRFGGLHAIRVSLLSMPFRVLLLS